MKYACLFCVYKISIKDKTNDGCKQRSQTGHLTHTFHPIQPAVKGIVHIAKLGIHPNLIYAR